MHNLFNPSLPSSHLPQQQTSNQQQQQQQQQQEFRYICLQGTLPITFRSQRYCIPLQIWLPYEYPTLPPRVMLVPTPDMGINAGRFVDAQGRVKHPYLEHWHNRTEVFLLGKIS